MSLYCITATRFKGETLVEVRIGEGSPLEGWISPPLFASMAKVLGKLDDGHTVATCFPDPEGFGYLGGPTVRAIPAPGGGRTLGIKPRYGDGGLTLKDLPAMADDWSGAFSEHYGGYVVRFMATRRPHGGLVLYRFDITPASADVPDLPPDGSATATQFARGTDDDIWATVLVRAKRKIDLALGLALADTAIGT